MSRARTRPTREETRDRLLRGAARVFSEKGIGNASIEDICDEAGFSRGAFYSNFKAKDELVIALLADHMEASSVEVDRLFDVASDPTDFVENLESDRRQHRGPIDLDATGMLYVELLLYALRNPENRPLLVEYQRRQREANVRILKKIVDAVGRDYPVPLDQAAALIMALDVGIGINRLVDPEMNPSNQFTEFMGLLQQLWLSSPE